MTQFKLSPFGTLEYSKYGIILNMPSNNITSSYDHITEIEFKNPSLFSKGSIIIKFDNKPTISCRFKKKQQKEAKKVYGELLTFKNMNNNLIENFDENNLKYCHECGTKNILAARFCMNCGNKLIEHDNNNYPKKNEKISHNLSNNTKNNNKQEITNYNESKANKQNIMSDDQIKKDSTLKVEEETDSKNNHNEKKIEISIKNISATEIKSKGKTKYSYNSKELFVEELALEYYKNNNLIGLWSENDYWWFIYALLFWDIIFMKTDTFTQFSMNNPNFEQAYNFALEFNGIPNDFFKDTFYEVRKDAIKHRMIELEKANLSDEIENSYNKHYGMLCRPIQNWNKYTLNDLLLSTNNIQNKQLLSIMDRLIRNFNQNRSGLPDLTLIDNDNNLFFVEVKSKKDTLSENQIKWHEYLVENARIPVEIFTINKSRRQINNFCDKYNLNIQVTDEKEISEKTFNLKDYDDRIDDLELTITTSIKDEYEYENEEKKYKDIPKQIGNLLKYTIILYLKQIREHPIKIDIWKVNYLDEDYSPEQITNYVLEKKYIKKPEGSEYLSNVLNSYTIPELKEVLREKHLKLGGRKQELVDRLLDNVEIKELCDKFNKPYYILTDKGIDLIKDNPQVTLYKEFLKNSYDDYDIDEYESQYQCDKNNKDPLEILINYLKYEGNKYANKGNYWYYEFSSLERIADIYFQKENFEKSLTYYLKVFIVDLSLWGNNCINLNYIDLRDYYINNLLKSYTQSNLNEEQLKYIFEQDYDTINIPVIIISKEEMFNYLLDLINGTTINQISENIEKRVTIPEELKWGLHYQTDDEKNELIKKLKDYKIFN